MCGINGIISFQGKYDQNELESIVHTMNDKITYRGPDEDGIYAKDGLCLGMRRLSVIDLASGRQPIYNEDKSIVIVFNGEIYNFQDLRVRLEEKQHVFTTNADTEVVVHTYEEYGTECLHYLDGMFVFALYDKNSGKVILARDRMGEKPCYYYQDDERFLFGSEIKSLLSTNLITKTINKTALCQYLQLTYIPAPLSIFEQVYKLEAGHYLEIGLDGMVKDNMYWDVPYGSNEEQVNHFSNYEEASSVLYEKIFQSVKERMVSDVPIGAFLSGGIDSSSIVGVMSRLSEKPIETFTIGFQEKEYDERQRARRVAEHNRTNHHEYILDYDEAIPILDELFKNMDEPFADSSVLPTYFVSKFARQYVSVVLTGDAGDELFAGYSKYLIGYYSDLYKKVPRFFRKKVFEPIIYKIKDTNAFTRKVRKVIENAEKDVFTQRKELMCLGFKEKDLARLLKESYMDKGSLDFIHEIYYKNKTVDELSKTQYTDLKVVLEGDMLTKVDRMSMLNSLETRTPLLARDIVEFSTKIPSDFKLEGKKLKKILKDSMKELLPEGLDRYPKTGFGVPIDGWFKESLKDSLEEVLNEERIKEQGIFNYDTIKTVLEEHNTGKQNRKSELWTLFVFQKWYTQFMDEV